MTLPKDIDATSRREIVKLVGGAAIGSNVVGISRASPDAGTVPEYESRIIDVTFSPDETHVGISTGRDEGLAEVYSLDDFSLVERIYEGDRITGIHFHPEGKYVGASDWGGNWCSESCGTIDVFRVGDGWPHVVRLEEFEYDCRGVRFSPDGNYIAGQEGANGPESVYVYNVGEFDGSGWDLEAVLDPGDQNQRSTTVSWHPGSEYIAYGTSELAGESEDQRYVRIHEAGDDWSVVEQIRADASAVVFGPFGDYLAHGDDDQLVVRDVDTWEPVATVSASERVRSIAFHPATGDLFHTDGTDVVFRPRNGWEGSETVVSSDNSLRATAVSADKMVAGSENGVVIEQELDAVVTTPTPNPTRVPPAEDGEAPVFVQQLQENPGVLGLLVAAAAALGSIGLGVVGYGSYRVLGSSNDDEVPGGDTTALLDAGNSSSDGTSSNSQHGGRTPSGADGSNPRITEFADLQLGPTVEESSTYHLCEATTPADQSVWVATPPAGDGTTWSADVVSTFAEAGETWAKLDPHPHLLTVHASGVDATPWIALEPVEASSVVSRADELAAEEIVEVLEQVSEAIHHLHRYGLAYEILTPESVLVDDEVGATLRGVLDHLPEPERTPYDPPAPADDAATDDLYRIGAIAYALLTETTPDQSAPEYRPSPTDVHSTLPPEADEILQTALEPDPNDRHDTALHLRDDFRSLRESL